MKNAASGRVEREAAVKNSSLAPATIADAANGRQPTTYGTHAAPALFRHLHAPSADACYQGKPDRSTHYNTEQRTKNNKHTNDYEIDSYPSADPHPTLRVTLPAGGFGSA